MSSLNDYVPSGGEGRLRDRILTLVRGLREEGVSTPAHAGVDALEALVVLPSPNRLDVREALRTTLLNNPSDRAVFDRLFREFWFGTGNGSSEVPLEEKANSLDEYDPLSDPPGTEETPRDKREGDDPPGSFRRSGLPQFERNSGEEEVEPGGTRAIYSPDGERIDPSPSTERRPYDLTDEARLFCRRAARTVGRKRGRGRVDRFPDVRRALRENLQTGGVLLDLPRRQRRINRCRLIVLADVSRSVLDVIPSGYLLALLQTLHGTAFDAETLLFDHDVQTISRLLTQNEKSMEQLSDFTDELRRWGGGTRIGRAVEALRHQSFAKIHSRACVIIISDGLDQGDIDRLRQGMAWLRRRSGLVLWFNPLASRIQYEPQTRGMKAALPYIDGLFVLSGPGDLAEVSRQLPRLERGREAGYRFDPRRKACA